MNDKVRDLIRWVCEGDIKKSQQQCRIILDGISTQKDERFKTNMLRKLNLKKAELIELPYNLQEFLIAEDVTNFPKDRFILRGDEADLVNKVIATYKVAENLFDLGISYSPTVMLYGKSGGGKTTLARYIAHETKLPFVYVKLSGLVSSYLGSTPANISKVFDYAGTAPCVLCLDEIDAIGMARGQGNDVGEMNRIVITLMQELDRLPNNVIVIGATNRRDQLDEALLRRFNMHHEVLQLDAFYIKMLAESFFESAGYDTTNWLSAWCEINFSSEEMASTVVRVCTDKVVADEMMKITED